MCALRAALGLAVALLAGGCELSEVVTPAGEDVLVVEAVLREGEAWQHVLLHRSLDGRLVRGEPGARVVLRGPGGQETRLQEVSLGACAQGLFPERTDSLAVAASCYRTGALEVLAGGEYELRVDTERGEVIRGRTRVPGAFGLRSPAPPRDGRPICGLPPNTNVTLAWSQAAGAWSYLIAAEIHGLPSALARVGIELDVPERLELTGLAVSERDTTLVLPAQLGVFERADLDQELLRVLQHGFPEGVRVRVTVAAVDRNLVNGVRGGRFNPSGPTRISSVAGDGVGVFGALVPREVELLVWEDAPYPPCLG